MDFEPHPLLEALPEDLDVVLSSPHVELSQGVLQHNPATGGLRLAFSFDPGTRDHVELRAELRRGGQAVSEVWLYRWTS